MAMTIISKKPKEIDALLKEISDCVGTEPDETVLEITVDKLEKIRTAFQIKDEEIKSVIEDERQTDAVVSLVVERVALLATQL
jgi:hypothetical protein